MDAASSRDDVTNLSAPHSIALVLEHGRLPKYSRLSSVGSGAPTASRLFLPLDPLSRTRAGSAIRSKASTARDAQLRVLPQLMVSPSTTTLPPRSTTWSVAARSFRPISITSWSVFCGVCSRSEALLPDAAETRPEAAQRRQNTPPDSQWRGVLPRELLPRSSSSSTTGFSTCMHLLKISAAQRSQARGVVLSSCLTATFEGTSSA
mmetsp:Transcript_35073/g.112980  ORF Transcript_35073/g.112980 Transcript_35073/m.112980 type:complete len:206 (-) Transcript_35073:931-1548(-)